MTQPKLPKPDLAEHEEEATPFDDVLRTLLAAKPGEPSPGDNHTPKKPTKAD